MTSVIGLTSYQVSTTRVVPKCQKMIRLLKNGVVTTLSKMFTSAVISPSHVSVVLRNV